MSSPALTQILLGSLLDSPAVVELGSKAGCKALAIIKSYFADSAFLITSAYQNAYAYALVAISVGVADDKIAFTKKIFNAKITREFAEQIESHYFQPFIQASCVQVNLALLRKQIVKALKTFAKQKDTIFQIEELTEEDLAALICYRDTFAITDLVLAQMQQIATLDDTLAAFLRYDDLLGDAILFFFRELIRQDERLHKTQTALQQEGLCIEVRNLQTALKTAEENLTKAIDEKSPNLGQLALQLQSLQQTETAWQTRHEQLIRFSRRFENQLTELLTFAQDAYATLAEIHDDVKETKEAVNETKSVAVETLQLLKKMMARQGLSSQVKPRNEFTQHNSTSLKLIREAASQLKQLSPQTPGYSRVSILVGSALSSAGKIEQAEQFFQQAIENAENNNDKAEGFFNLFQVQLRRKAYPEALSNLQTAIAMNRKKYALHHVKKYPMQQLLGAGGMGCVLLCQNQDLLRDTAYEQVAVKCFWESHQGTPEKVFGEALMMHKIAGQYVPKPLDYGYVDEFNEDRAFFVTEYLDGAIDGETWLETYGPMDLEIGLQVGLQIAEGLQVAHQAGIYHLDLKPANILLLKKTSEVSVPVSVKIIDFGLSKVATSLRQEATTVLQSHSGLSMFGQAIFGTLDYAPPEQRGYIDYGEPSAKSDVFAFGKTLYRLLTNEKPIEVEPESLEHAPDWFKLLYRCTRADPAKRPESARELVSHLKAIAAASHAKLQTQAKRPNNRQNKNGKQSSLAKQKAEEEQKRQAELAKQKAEAEQKGQLFEFKVLTVNAKGKIANTKRHQAHYQTEDLGNGVTLEMVYIPGGTFLMGSPENEADRDSNEGPQHSVTVQPFFMGKYPVTQAQWQAVMSNNPSAFKWKNRPVECVSYDEVVAFCQRLSEKTGKDYRLPSEAQWEYACRAGTTTPFHFGETITTNLANYEGNYTYASGQKGVYRKQTTDVGQFPPNAFGLYDMHGNVWEWCADNYQDNYQRAPTDGSIWEKSSKYRVLRGGSWYVVPDSSRTAARDGCSPDNRIRSVGFRIVGATRT